jgi:hypothetical protein
VPSAEIRETTVTPDADGSIVRLHISDVPLAVEHTPAIRIMIEAKLPPYRTALLEQYQREAIQRGREPTSACSGHRRAYFDVPSGSIPLFPIASEARPEARNSINRLEPSISHRAGHDGG